MPPLTFILLMGKMGAKTMKQILFRQKAIYLENAGNETTKEREYTLFPHLLQ